MALLSGRVSCYTVSLSVIFIDADYELTSLLRHRSGLDDHEIPRSLGLFCASAHCTNKLIIFTTMPMIYVYSLTIILLMANRQIVLRSRSLKGTRCLQEFVCSPYVFKFVRLLHRHLLVPSSSSHNVRAYYIHFHNTVYTHPLTPVISA
jgi:hypothetical protein